MDERPMRMEDSNTVLPIGSEGMNLVPPLSVEQFLYSLARTPTPTRFKGRRERLLKQRLRASLEIKNVRDGSRSTNSEARPGNYDGAARDMIVTPEPQPDIEKDRHMSSDELDTPILENNSQSAPSVLFYPSTDVVDLVQIDNVADENDYNDGDLFIRQMPIASDELLQLNGHHQHHDSGDEKSMFVRANRIDEIEGLQSTGSAKLDQKVDDTITPYTPVHSDLEILHRQTQYERENSTHEVQGNTNTSIMGDTTGSALGLKKQIRTYGIWEASGFKQLKTKTEIPRMLPVDELQITVDRVPSNLIYDLKFKAVDCNDDPIENLSSFPDQESRRMPKQRKVTNMSKKRKPLNEIRQTILRPKTDDLCKYMLPNNGDMSPSTRKRLKTSMTCSDGFEGSEGLPTGRTMRVRLPRRYTQTVCQAVVYIPELILVSSRDCTEKIADLSELQSEDAHLSEAAKCNHLENDIVVEDLTPMTEGLPGSLQDSNIIIKQHSCPQSRILKGLIPAVRSGNDPVKSVGVMTPAMIRRPSCRVTFSDNLDVAQIFRMISAPIIMKSGSDSVASESSATDDEETSDEDEDEDEEYDYRDSSGSSDEAESERDDYQSMEDGMCGDGKGEAFGASCIPLALIQTTFQIARRVKLCNNDKIRSPRRLVRNDQLGGKCADGIDLVTKSRNTPYIQQFEERGEMLTTEASCPQNTAAEKDYWRPRIPITSSRLIEVDNDIVEYPASPNPAIHQYDENLKHRKQSQAFVKLRDPEWQVSHHNGYEQSWSQDGNQDSPQEELRCYIFEEQPTYLARALESFNNALQRDFAFARSKSAPAEQRQQESCPTGSVTINSIFRGMASPQNRHLLKAKSTGLEILTRSVSVEAGPIHARKRIRQLPLIPPFQEIKRLF